MPQLADGRPTRSTTRTACSHCTLDRGAGARVTVHTTHEKVLCPRHRLWTGDGNTGAPTQIWLDVCPAILAAYRHHRNLAARSGRQAVAEAFETASLISWRWYEQFGHFTASAGRLTALTSRNSIPPAHAGHRRRGTLRIRRCRPRPPPWPRPTGRTWHCPKPGTLLGKNQHPDHRRLNSQGTGDPIRRWMPEERTARRLGGHDTTAASGDPPAVQAPGFT